MVALCQWFNPETYVNARQGCFRSNVYTSLFMLAVPKVIIRASMASTLRPRLCTPQRRRAVAGSPHSFRFQPIWISSCSGLSADWSCTVMVLASAVEVASKRIKAAYMASSSSGIVQFSQRGQFLRAHIKHLNLRRDVGLLVSHPLHR